MHRHSLIIYVYQSYSLLSIIISAKGNTLELVHSFSYNKKYIIINILSGKINKTKNSSSKIEIYSKSIIKCHLSKTRLSLNIHSSLYQLRIYLLKYCAKV